MINIIYTAHAKQRMALRGISDEMVRQAVEQPDATDTGYEARSLAYRRFSEGRIIGVIPPWYMWRKPERLL